MELLWLLPLSLRIGTAHVLAPILQKILAAKHGREERFLLHFVVAGSLAILISTALGVVLNKWMFAAACLGALSAMGAYCQWRAMDISLSRNALFTWADDLLAMLFGWMFLSEGAYFNATLLSGGILAFVVVISFGVRESRRKTMQGAPVFPLGAFVGWVAGYSFAYAVVISLIRTLAITDVVSVPAFLVGWYAGAMCVPIVILLIKRKIRGALEKLTPRDCVFGTALGAVIIAALAAHYYKEKPPALAGEYV